MQFVKRILNLATKKSTDKQCNYADNYYGDQVCRVTDKTSGAK